jgi:BirA family biotin operon repressor/biotin-[acetyl-CoA-carboxylase] ligase
LADPAAPADLAAAPLSAQLATARLGRLYEPHAACSSTNDLCAERARAGAPEGLVVLADAQAGGRGQKGRRWHSSAGENLTFSLLLRPPVRVTALPPLTLLAGVAVARAIAGAIAPRLKWPNDVLCDTAAGPRKVCGILTEMATLRDEVKHVVVGIGLNVNQTTFAPEIAELASSLRLIAGRPFDRAQILAAVLNAFEPLYDATLHAGSAAFLPAWRQLAALPRRCRVSRPEGLLDGTAIDVDESGALLVASNGATVRVLSGELSPL